MSSLSPAIRIANRKIGPRALSFLPQSGLAQALSNCGKCVAAPLQPFVAGEDGTFASISLLVRGWYAVQISAAYTGARVFVAQCRPSEACKIDPLVDGYEMEAGEKFELFVEDSSIDGAIVVLQCGSGITALSCQQAGPPIPLVMVNRVDTTLRMSETGDTESADASRPSPSPGNACGPVAGP